MLFCSSRRSLACYTQKQLKIAIESQYLQFYQKQTPIHLQKIEIATDFVVDDNKYKCTVP